MANPAVSFLISAASGACHPRGARPPAALQSIWMLLFLFVLGCLLLASGVPADALSPVQAGWIDSFDGPASDYVLSRDGENPPVQYFMPLLAGDRIEIRAADGRMRIRLGEDGPLVLYRTDSPYSVPGTGAPPTVWGNLMAWASGLFTELHGVPEPVRTISAVSKGEIGADLASGLLYTEAVALAAGRRPLALAWRGGTPPFRVQLSRDVQGTDPLVDLNDLPAAQCLTPVVDLIPGQYLLEIRDATGKHLITDVAVVEPAKVPRPEPAAIPEGLPDEVSRTIAAAWLAGQQGGWVWRLEAYQAIIGDHAPAVLLREALLEDRELSPPPMP